MTEKPFMVENIRTKEWLLVDEESDAGFKYTLPFWPLIGIDKPRVYTLKKPFWKRVIQTKKN